MNQKKLTCPVCHENGDNILMQREVNMAWYEVFCLDCGGWHRALESTKQSPDLITQGVRDVMADALKKNGL